MADEKTISGSALLAELNDLLKLDIDSVQAYTLAMEKVESVTYRETLEGFRADHERHIRELAELIRARGGDPIEMPHVPTGAFKLAVQGIGAMVGRDRSLLMAFKANEGQAVEKYRRHAERPHEPEVAAVLRRAAADEEKHYEWAESRLKKLGAGPNTALGKAEAVVETVHGKMADAIEAVDRKAVIQPVQKHRSGKD